MFYFNKCEIVFNISALLIGFLFPIVFADFAAAKEDKNKESSVSYFLYWQRDNNDKKASPAPTLSIGSDANAGHLVIIFLLLRALAQVY